MFHLYLFMYLFIFLTVCSASKPFYNRIHMQNAKQTNNKTTTTKERKRETKKKRKKRKERKESLMFGPYKRYEIIYLDLCVGHKA